MGGSFKTFLHPSRAANIGSREKKEQKNQVHKLSRYRVNGDQIKKKKQEMSSCVKRCA